MNWIKIKGFDNYMISDEGIVKALSFRVKRGSGYYQKPEQILMPKYNHDGYKQVHLYKDQKGYSFVIHRLVAEAFLPHIPGKDCVNHINGNKQDNCIHNLEWCDKRENHDHAVRYKLKIKNGDKPVGQYDLQRNLISIYKSGIEAARKLSFSSGNISKAARSNKSYKNFIWKYQ